MRKADPKKAAEDDSVRLIEESGIGTAGHTERSDTAPPVVGFLERYIQERYFEIDRGEHGGLTQRGMNQVLDEMDIHDREERRWYRRVWTQMGNAEAEVRAESLRELQATAPARVSGAQ